MWRRQRAVVVTSSRSTKRRVEGRRTGFCTVMISGRTTSVLTTTICEATARETISRRGMTGGEGPFDPRVDDRYFEHSSRDDGGPDAPTLGEVDPDGEDEPLRL
jgi:hypothetical protein